MLKMISIQGVRGVNSKRDFQLGNVTAFLGKNGTAKSSVIVALRAILTGYFPSEEKNQSQPDAFAIGWLDNGESIRVSLNEKGLKHYLSGKGVTKKDANIVREELGKIPTDVAEILSRPGQYALDLKPEEFSLLFGSTFKTTVDVNQLLDRLGATPDEAAYFKSLYTAGDIGFQGLETVYKTLSEKKRLLGRDITSAKAQADVLCASATGANLSTLLSRKETILKKLEEAQSFASRQRKFDSDLAKYEADRCRIDEIKKYLADNKLDDIPDGALERAISQLTRVQDEISECNRLIGVLERNIASSRSVMKQLDSNVCPISGLIVCTTNKKVAAKQLEEMINENERVKNLQEQKLRDLQESAQDLQQRIGAIREKEIRNKSLLEKEQELKILTQNLPARPVPPTASAGDTHESIKADLEKITAEIQAEESAQKGKLLLESVKSQEAENVLVESLRAMTAPKGRAYSLIMTALSGDLTEMINDSARELGVDLEYEFRIDSGMTLYGKGPGAVEMYPVKQMSTGERFMTNLLLATILNHITGNQFIVLDNIDCLDEENLERVMTLITSPLYASRFSNIILSGVNHPDTEKIVEAHTNVVVNKL